MTVIKPHIVVDETNVEGYLNYYKEKLSLQAWDIVVKFSKAMSGDAEVTYKRDRQIAIITMLDHAFYTSEDFAHDMEMTLVHELVHLVLADITPEQADTMEERATEHLAKALVNVRRCPYIEL